MQENSTSSAVPSPDAGGRRRYGSEAVWRVVERVARHAAWLTAFVFLAPAIGPRAYGVFVLALSGVAVMEALLKEVPAGAIAAIQRLEEEHLASAFVATAGAGTAVSCVLFLLAERLASMVDNPALADVYQSLSLLPVLSALAAVPLGLLKRRRRHATLFAIRLTGTTLGAGAVIGLGLAGSGAWCLVAQVVIQCFVEAALSWAAMRRGIGFGYSGRHVRELFATLPAAAMAPAFAAVDKQLPRFLVGSMLGPTAAGLYLLASVIAEAVAAGLALAAILCELALPRTRDGLAPLVEGVCFVAAPAAVCVSGSMQWLMTEITDPRWWGAVAVAQIMLFAAAAAAVSRRPSAAAGSSMLWTLSRILVCALAAPYGLIAVGDILLLHSVCVCAATIGATGPVKRSVASGGPALRGSDDLQVRGFPSLNRLWMPRIVAPHNAGAARPAGRGQRRKRRARSSAGRATDF